ncbi:MAG: hypothetical protein ACLRSW_12790 [Christensenellaceae bacterium]
MEDARRRGIFLLHIEDEALLDEVYGEFCRVMRRRTRGRGHGTRPDGEEE